MRNRYFEAFKEPANIVGLTAATTVAAAMLSPVVLAVGVAAELAYLALVPGTRWYEARLSKFLEAEKEQRRIESRSKVLPSLRPELQERFARLECVREEIRKQTAAEEIWFGEILHKLDDLLEKFLHFAAREAQFHAYLLAALEAVEREKRASRTSMSARNIRGRQLRRDRERPSGAFAETNRVRAAQDQWVQDATLQVKEFYEQELGGVRLLCEAEPDEKTKAVLEKRAEVLTRRREHALKIGRIMTNLNHQLDLLEDTFGLISDEIRARPPEQVLADIEDVVLQTNAMAQTLEEMASYEQKLNRLLA